MVFIIFSGLYILITFYIMFDSAKKSKIKESSSYLNFLFFYYFSTSMHTVNLLSLPSILLFLVIYLENRDKP
ncbi:MAG: hypothetical protein DI617_07310 [Streptococcus pyogenes]|nr:MAG: hypothetical protein DI617_07310 [Streptococcus pyogenes]